MLSIQNVNKPYIWQHLSFLSLAILSGYAIAAEKFELLIPLVMIFAIFFLLTTHLSFLVILLFIAFLWNRS